MEKAPCWNESVACVDLSSGTIEIEHPSADFYRKYGGGSGLGLYYILKNIPQGTDAFSKENIITFFTGPITGLPVSGNSRVTVNAKSPAGGAIGDSQIGGYFPASLKASGFDGVVIQGRAALPVYLFLHDGKIEIRNAEHLWGKDTADVEDLLIREIGDRRIQVLQCGVAGENLVRYAGIINMANRAAGRTGLGAVMGSKNLRAIVTLGKEKVGAFDPSEIHKWAKRAADILPNNPDVYCLTIDGSASGVGGLNAIGSLPSFNYSEGQFANWEKISGETMTKSILKKRDTCFGCVVRCKRIVETEYKEEKVLTRYGGPEYESIAALGCYCGIDDLNAIALANQLCNMYGLDTISTGATIAFAMDCFRHGLITAADTDGIDLQFGNAEAVIQMIRKIAFREGFGAVLAEGSNRAAKVIGENAADFLTTCKGTEAPAHMPQAKKTLGLIYAVNPFGADHQSHEHDPVYEQGSASDLARSRLAKLGLSKVQEAGSMNEEKVRFAYLTELYYSSLDSYNLCQYVFGPAWNIFSAEETVQILKAATGWDISVEEFLTVGERRLNMMRLFNQREGFSREHDVLPGKFYRPLEGTGPTAGVRWDPQKLEGYKDSYYKFAGWSLESGNPTPEKITALGLDWIEL